MRLVPFVCISFSLWVLVTCLYEQGDNLDQIYKMFQEQGQGPTSIWPERRKRALFTFLSKAARQGKMATQKLLQGATKTDLLPKIRSIKVFRKPGNYETALIDFYSVKPSSVSNLLTNRAKKVSGKVGRVGDRIIVVKNSGLSGHPTLEIMHPRDPSRSSNIIAYGN